MKKLCRSNSTFKHIAFLFSLWFATVCAISFFSDLLPIPLREGYNYVEIVVKNPVFFWNWANFDGIHYLDIARRGYGISQQAFFPLYPKLLNFLTPVFQNKDLLSGIFISNFSFLIALYIFYKLIILDYSEKVADNSLVFLLVFPTSFFFGLVYSEGLFFLLTIACFYASRKEKWLLAGLLGLLAANARFIGIFLFPALICEWYGENKFKNLKLNLSTSLRARIKNFLPILLVPFGLLSYMRFLWLNFNDPLMFIHTQPFFGAGRTGGKIVLLYQVFYRYLKMILTTKFDPLYLTVWMELIVAVGFIILLVFSFSKKIRFSYLLFSIPAFLVPTLSGTFSSLPRYVLVLFPCFMCLGLIKNKIARNSLLLLFFLFFVISAVLFFKGYWIA